jgi:hypothetical protein
MSSTTTITMEHAMKQAITAAFKSLENKTYDVEHAGFLDVLLADLFGILFPRDSAVPAAEPKKKAPKKAKKVDTAEPVADGPAAAGAGAPVVEPVPEPKKKAPKKAKEPAPTGEVNIEWSPTWTKRVKPIVKELGLEMNISPSKQKEFAAHLNGLSKADYDARTFEEHMRDYLRSTMPVAAPKPAPSDGGRAAAGDAADEEEVEMTSVTFKGKVYMVDTRDPESMGVYTEGGEHLGHVGDGEFAGMKVE